MKEKMADPLTEIKGVGEVTAEKLRKAGFTTIVALAVTPVRDIMERTGLEYKPALSLVEKAREMITVNYMTGQELWEKRRKMLRCTTGSPKLDATLGGGIETQAMTELIGEYGAGKTQLCLTICATAQQPKEKGGLEGTVLFVDSEGTFSPDRIYGIAEARGLDPQQILSNIIIARVYTSDHQAFIEENLYKVCPQENVKLVIVDSIISHFRGEYVGRESLAERQQKLNKHLHSLLRLAEAYNLAVVVTNQVQANPTPWAGGMDRPAGGHVMAHACTHRVMIQKSKKNTRKARVIDSPYLPEDEVKFAITAKGIEDLEEPD
jgi:DNA repair protein RadA